MVYVGYDRAVSMVVSPGVAIVKNTFIDVPAALMYELSSAFPATRSRSEPDLAIFFCSSNNINSNSNDNYNNSNNNSNLVDQKLARTQAMQLCAQPKEDEEAGQSDSATTVPEDTRSDHDGPGTESPAPATTTMSTATLLLARLLTTAIKDEAHRLGQCRPCSYFALKKDGCRQGDDCPFCHACTYEEVRIFRKELLKGKRAHQRHARR
ncbi:unnamed protein product [Polarella glacialis]|uniref:C3H1-type domain-containing protein n=1 Tax=Polarella glacialis TaxID=89957 RepID=A0A813J3B3_POLGL|nr:unnamed protein product [Polarella glacialis]CAE8666527.1 unnamed protein product [Polarella glacialis]